MSRFYSDNRGLAPLIIIIASAIVLIAIPVAIYLVGQSQEIRKKAEGADGKVSCVVQGNRYDSDSITVMNNTALVANLIIHKRFCILNNETPNPLASPWVCNKWEDPLAGDENTSLPAGGSKTFTITVPNCKVAQLDIRGCECVDFPNCTKAWEGGMAFVMKANRTGYNPATGTCPQATGAPTATPTLTGAPTATVTPTGTRTPTATPTGTRTPTAPPGVTSTPRPTNTPAPPAATAPPGATPTSTPKPPVSGGIAPTVITIIGGGLLILVGLIL